MDNYLITAIILCFLLRPILSEPDLQQQNEAQDQLNPLNDHDNADTSTKEQDKRTIFNNINYGWAKHVGIRPSGHKYVLGYSPVHLKYSPVIRPLAVKHEGYAYGRPRVHFHGKRPLVQLRPVRPAHPVVWRPSVSVPVNPVIPVNVPHHHVVSKPVGVAHVDHVHVKPVHHVDHVHVDHVHQVQVPHADHVHNVPVHVDHVHVAPVNHVHQVPVQPVAVPQPVPVALPQPLLPVFPHPQIVHSPLFEVTKPDLGVLPLGATFPSPVLRHIPHAHPVVQFPLKPAVPAAIPLPQPVPVPGPAIFPQPVAPQPAYPPGTVVEYHGATNFVNQIPLHPIPVNGPEPVLPPHLHVQYPHFHQHLPAQPAPVLPHEQHDVQIPAGHTHFIQQSLNPNQFQQQLPQEAPSHFQPAEHVGHHNFFQQELPISNQQTHFQHEQNDQQFVQQQLPQDSGPRYQPADQVSNQQFFQGSVNFHQNNFEQLDEQEGGYVYPQPDRPFGHQSIQPGESDLQLPIHLPQHPGFLQNSRQFQQESSQLQSVFRPSIQLEPPYKK